MKKSHKLRYYVKLDKQFNFGTDDVLANLGLRSKHITMHLSEITLTN